MKLIKTILFLMCIAVNLYTLFNVEKLSLLSLVIVVVLLSLSAAIHLVIHECGHLIGGLMSGYKLVCLQIGPVNLVADRSQKLSVSIKNTHGGQCIMLPPSKTVIRYKAYNLGGIYANILASIVSVSLLFMGSLPATLLSIQLLFIGLIKIIANLYPRMTQSVPNDGYIISLLNRDPAIQKDYAAYLSLYAAMFWNEHVCREEYIYPRSITQNCDELLYYNGIQELLETYNMPNDCFMGRN